MDKDKVIKEIKSYIIIIVSVFAFRSSLFEPNHIPSGSLLPTNAIGDFILVNKFSYGLKVPYSEWLGKPVYFSEFKTPTRGDIVVFEYPLDRNILYVKRLIGVPGDEIEVRDNIVYLNGKEVERSEIKDPKDQAELFDASKYNRNDLKFYKNKIGEKEFVTAENIALFRHNNTQGKIKVPEGHYFVLGDNRDYSADSRIWGFVPQDHIRGRAMVVWFNMVYPWSEEEFHFRPGRIGTLL
ncbi:MAG: signal peptidase I [Bacteriovoracaceae bacterium]|jgi:signal peptidase I|nr:signal peptidase I [Bacteriovoracaceae bacterium]